MSKKPPIGIDALAQQRADQLVERIVPPDVLAHETYCAVQRAPGGGMDGARALVERLEGVQPRDRRADRGGRDSLCAARDGGAPSANVRGPRFRRRRTRCARRARACARDARSCARPPVSMLTRAAVFADFDLDRADFVNSLDDRLPSARNRPQSPRGRAASPSSRRTARRQTKFRSASRRRSRASPSGPEAPTS